MASPRPGPPAPTRRSPHAQRRGSGRARGGLWLAIGALALLAGLIAVSGSVSAQSGEVWVPEDYEHVIEGDSVPINVSFVAGEDKDTVTVTCDRCPEWTRDVTFDEAKANCEITDAHVDEEGPEHSERICQVSFPEGFKHGGGGPPPVETGEPSRRTTYIVELGPHGERDSAEFDVHLSSASACRPTNADPGSPDPPTGAAQRTDTLMLSASGHPEGETVTMRIRDGSDVFFEWTFTSGGEHVAYHRRWQVPMDLEIGGDERQAEIVVDANSGGEREPILLKPGVAHGRPVREPGFLDQAEAYNRTEGVEVRTLFAFFSAPVDCRYIAWDRDIQRVTADQVGDDSPSVVIRRHNAPPHPQEVQRVNTEETEVRGDVFTVNYTIPRDEEATEENASDPLYDVLFEKTQLADGNFIGEYNTSDYEVYPYEIEPEYEVLQDEVERLQTAELVLNLTYADGSPFTPNDTDEDLEIAFGPEGENPEFTFEANHREEGIWNVSQPLDFEYEPLDEYTWRIAGIQDTNGPPGEENYVPDTVTDIVDVVSARPRLNLTTVVDGTAVNATQRTERVHVSLDAEFLNGKPLTADNIDPSMGGIVLNINKKNQFDRVVDQERITLAHAGDGTWVESFRIGRSPSSAPVGDWDLRFEARDDRDPPNQNITEFPLRVDPADVSVTDTEAPPQLVDGGDIDYRFRLHYPDGSLATQRLLDESRGAQLDVRLERVSRADQAPIVERDLEPRPVSGGQAWELSLNSTKIVPGNHYFNVSGVDVHGNPIGPHASDLFTVLFNGEFRNSTTPICPTENGTETRCEVQRGETVYVVFPGASGDEGMFGDRPEIRVHRQDASSGRWVLFREDVWLSPQQFFNLTGRDVGENHVGRFVTDRSTPADTYRLVILGRNQDDTGFAGFSQTFNVTRVPVQREVVQPFPDSAKKTERITARFEHETGDVIDTTIAESGAVRARNIEIDKTGVGTFARWQPPSSFPTGPVSVHIEGRDLFGNPFEVDLGPIQLQPVTIQVEQDGPLPEEAPRGETARFDVQMTYETGTTFRGGDGNPEVVVRDLQGNEVDEGRAIPQVGHWQIRWTPRADLPSGTYEVALTGTDNAGNVVEDFVSDPIEVTAGTVTGDVPSQPPSNVRRGETVSAQLSFPTEITGGNATVTTGADTIGEPQVSIEGSTVHLRFPTDRSTVLADAYFTFTGSDVVGNNLTVETDRFSVRTQDLSIDWVEQPPRQVSNNEPVRASFVVQYPDGSFMRPGEGTPIVGLFAVDQPLGQVDASPSEGNPTVWEVEWEPPDDTRTDVPYHFSASARDQHRNDAPPVASRGFFVQNPVVPDYVPGPGAGPLVLSVVLAALAALVRRRR